MATLDWNNTRRAFEHVRSLDPVAREKWFATCGDASMVNTLRAMVAVDRSEGLPLDEPGSILDASGSSSEPSASGERLGPFEILGVLGTGRTSIVYRVRQEFPLREAALKVLRATLWNEDFSERRGRFFTEVHASARLSHPGIVSIHESGTFAEPGGAQRPYLLMELVAQARPITQFASGLSRPAQLDLLLQLCRAVGHAHRHGVLHRDLKPGNVLVDASGRVRVIDFGIARLEDGPRDTLTGQLIGTPAYMSPEQAMGGEADTRSDVYAIGLIAAEVLGERSRSDLAAVLSKAVAAEPGDRYQSVSELEQEFARVLAGVPVMARPIGGLEVTRRFVSRHRVACAAGAIVCGLGVGAVILLARYAERAATEGEAAADTASFMLDHVVRGLEDRVGPSERRRVLAESLLPRIARLEARAADPKFVEARAALLRVIFDIEQQSGDFKAAARHCEEALEIRRRLAEAAPDDLARRADFSIAVVRRGDLFGAEGSHEEMLARYEQALAIDRELRSLRPSDRRFASNLLYSFERMATWHWLLGSPERSELFHRERLSLADELVAAEPHSDEWLLEQVEARYAFCVFLSLQGRDCEFAGVVERRIEQAERQYAVDPQSRGASMRLVKALLATAAEDLGEPTPESSAMSTAVRAHAVAQRLAESDPSDGEAARWLVVACGELAAQHARVLDLEGMQRRLIDFDEALTRLESHLDPQSLATWWWRARSARARILHHAGLHADADASVRSAIEMLEHRRGLAAGATDTQVAPWVRSLASLASVASEAQAAARGVEAHEGVAAMLLISRNLRDSGRFEESRTMAEAALAATTPEQTLWRRRAIELASKRP